MASPGPGIDGPSHSSRDWKVGGTATISRIEAQPRPYDPVKAKNPHPDAMKVADLERVHLEATFTEKWQQKKTLEQRIQDGNADRDRDRESSQNMQKFEAGQFARPSCNPAQVQDARPTGPLIRQRRMQRLRQVIPNLQPKLQRHFHMSHVSQVAAVGQKTKGKLRLTSPSDRPTGTPGQDTKYDQICEENNGNEKKAPPASQAVIPRTRVQGHACASPRTIATWRTEEVNISRKSATSSEGKRLSNEDSSDSDSSLSSSEDEAAAGMTVPNLKDGSTTYNFRPYVNSSSLKEFDTKASLRERTSWWERFMNMASQGGWSSKMRIQELKLKVPSTARDWFNQPPKSIQRDWKEIAAAFRKKYCKAHTSYSEREPAGILLPSQFGCCKADIDVRQSGKRLEKHSISDLEYIVEQDVEVWTREDQDVRATRTPISTLTTSRKGTSSPELLAERMSHKPKMWHQDASGSSLTQAQDDSEPTHGSRIESSSAVNIRKLMSTQDLVNEGFGAMDNMGWRPLRAMETRILDTISRVVGFNDVLAAVRPLRTRYLSFSAESAAAAKRAIVPEMMARETASQTLVQHGGKTKESTDFHTQELELLKAEIAEREYTINAL
ncbi:hypothetical protein GQ600_17758 [Phytophthora cactorum]|nr:hypothetical protein GQ600_17758 [Phytophthora cactorum]